MKSNQPIVPVTRGGPLAGVRVVEVAGIGPGPMCAMLLSDMGADVVRVERPGEADLGTKQAREMNFVLRGRPYIQLDLKDAGAHGEFFKLVGTADVLIEGFRPGVMERLGLGPQECLSVNPRLIYGRMTGWGQQGPASHTAGHDLNFLALTGALHSIGRRGQPPTPPLNLVADYGGGALYLAMGVAAALFERSRSGKGQVIDSAIVDGVASMLTTFFGMKAAGLHSDQRGENVLDGGAYFYEVYECSDGKYLSVACIEQKFHDLFLERIGLNPSDFPARFNREHWQERKERIAALIKQKARDEWADIFQGSDACVTPVLSLGEALSAQHLVARETFVGVADQMQPAPAPRFSRTCNPHPRPGGALLAGVSAVLDAWGAPPAPVATNHERHTQR